jgi:hypothetical protein
MYLFNIKIIYISENKMFQMWFSTFFNLINLQKNYENNILIKKLIPIFQVNNKIKKPKSGRSYLKIEIIIIIK